MEERQPTQSVQGVPLDYRRPSTTTEKDARYRSRLMQVLVWLAVILVPIFLFFAVEISQMGKVRTPALKAKCASNLKNIAAGLITYSNVNNGRYPDTIEDLFVSSGMTSAIFICPAGNDSSAAGTVPQQVAEMQAGGHLSYIYLGKGLTADGSATTVVCYEPLANHGNQGMNVLFNDYHTAWLTPAEGKQLIASIVPGQPTIWPARGGK